MVPLRPTREEEEAPRAAAGLFGRGPESGRTFLVEAVAVVKC